jgi:hypothetical protein
MLCRNAPAMILVQRFSDDEDEYVLIDPYGDVDGDPFYDIEDVVDFITNNEQVEAYLATLWLDSVTEFTLKPPPLFNYDYHHRTYLYA